VLAELFTKRLAVSVEP